jgi:hypothetical protein
MTRRRRRSSRRQQQRTLLQIAILTVALAFVGLNSPAVRTSVNATLVWVVTRGLILGVIVLAIMWTYQYCRPPKVKRRSVKQQLPRRPRPRHTPKHGTAPPVTGNAENAATAANGYNGQTGPASEIGYPAQSPVPQSLTRETLLDERMSGVHAGPWTGE